MKALTLAALFCLLPGKIWAQGQSSIITENPKKALSFVASAEFAQSLHDVSSDERELTSLYSAQLAYAMTELYTLKGSWGFSQTLKPEALTTATNAKIAVAHSTIDWGRYTKATPEAAVILPTNIQQRDDTSYRGAVSIKSTFSWAIENIPLGVSYTPGINKNFHAFETDMDSAYNIDYSLTHLVSLDYQISEKVSVVLEGEYRWASAYSSTKLGKYALGQSLNWQAGPQFLVSLGHSNGHSILAPNGRSQSLEIFNRNTSQITGAMTLTF